LTSGRLDIRARESEGGALPAGAIAGIITIVLLIALIAACVAMCKIGKADPKRILTHFLGTTLARSLSLQDVDPKLNSQRKGKKQRRTSSI